MHTNATALEEAREILWIAERLADTTEDPRDAKTYRAAARQVVAMARHDQLGALSTPPVHAPNLDAVRLWRWFQARASHGSAVAEVGAALGGYVSARRSLASEQQLALFAHA